MKVSVVIGARNEFPNVVHTVHSIINDLETFLSPREFEIILVDNSSTDNTSTPQVTGTSDFLRTRGIFHDRVLKIVFDPVMGNVSARNKGAMVATGEYLFFSDAHMSYRPGSFKAMIEAIDATGGIVHPAVDWMGAYPSDSSYQYSVKLGEKMWGTWNKLKLADTAFYIPMCGHCCLGMKRQQFLDFGGYNPYFRCYGGGEFYLDMKWWRYGGTVATEPRALAYHLSAGRGYAYHYDDLIHNMMLCAYTIGGPAWAERILFAYLNKRGVNEAKVRELYAQALEEGEADRLVIDKQAIRTFEEVIDTLPWDTANEKLHGRKKSGLLIYDFRKLLRDDIRVLFDASPLQQILEQKIHSNWANYIYKPV